MAGLLDFLGGAAGAYAGIKNEDRQRAQMEAYSARLREQEMKDWERKERIRQQLQREGRVGEYTGSAQIAPTGQVVMPRYDETGTNLSLEVLGEIPGQREAMEQERLRQQQKDELDRDVKQSQIVRNLRPRTGQGSGEPSVRDQIAVESHNMRLQDRAFETALEEAGIMRTPQGYIRPGATIDDDPTPVSPAEIARIRRAASGQAPKETGRQGTVPQMMGLLGSLLGGGGPAPGSSPANPVVVSSEKEAESLPSGTYISLNGRRGQVP